MTLLEALIAVAIVSGVMATAIETFRVAVGRSVVAEMEAEAANLAESLLVRAGEDLPLQAQQTIQDERGTLTWRINNSRQPGTDKKVNLVKVDSYVKVVRGDLVVEQELSTLKLKLVQPR